MSQKNVELTRRAFQAFNDRDLDTVLASLHDDVEASRASPLLRAGTAATKGSAAGGSRLLGAFPDFYAEILEVRDLGEFMVVILRVRGRGAESDTPLDAAIWHVNHFRNGRSSGGASTQPRAKPSKPWGCGSRRRPPRRGGPASRPPLPFRGRC